MIVPCSSRANARTPPNLSRDIAGIEKAGAPLLSWEITTTSTTRRDRPMPRIVPAITTLLQHLHMLSNSPEVYRPSACPHCGLGGLWSHGCYERKPDRGPHSSGTLNPIPIPRYFCRGCGRTCSRLPQCIAPRRWYGWAVQQLVLQLLLAGCSLHRCACWMGLDRRTAGRWRGWLDDRCLLYTSDAADE